jgi:hypothetical protein
LSRHARRANECTAAHRARFNASLQQQRPTRGGTFINITIFINVARLLELVTRLQHRAEINRP